MAWVWRVLGAFAALAALLALSVAVATGPIRTSAGAASTQEPATAGGEAPAAAPSPSASVSLEDIPLGPIPYDRRLRAVFLGDSITRGMTEPASGEVGDRSWFYGVIDDTAGVLAYVGTIAENGMTTDWMASQAWNAVALSPDIVVVHGGTNDVSGEVEPAAVVANLEEIRRVVTSVGMRLAVCTVPPRNEPDAEARAIAVNTAIAAWAEANGVILLDTAAPLRAPGGGWKKGMTEDGLHPTPEAVALMSEAANRVLRTIPLGV